jgi:hypothetical protein
MPSGIIKGSDVNGNQREIRTDLQGRIQLASHTVLTTSDRVEEIDPLSEHYAGETLLNLVNIATNTTGYGYFDMAGYRYFALQIETSGAAPVDVLTVTLEATVMDTGAAPAACTYQDVTNDLFGVPSVVDADDMWICDTPVAFKYVRVRYNTSNGGGNDADLTVYLKRMW